MLLRQLLLILELFGDVRVLHQISHFLPFVLVMLQALAQE